MELKTTFRKIKILFLLFALFSYSGIYAQTRIFATTVSSSDDTDNASNAIDHNLGTRARVRASSGIAVGIGQYSGHIELQFDSTLPQNTTTYVKIGADANLFPALLGGSLGGLLSDVLGGVLVGNQEFTVQAKNGNAVVLQGNSQIASDFGGQRLRVITNAAGEYFLMITPNQQYNRIRLTNRVGSLLGLGNTRRLDVFEAFYVTDMANCGSPAFTSFSGSGISLDALQLGGVGVENPQFAIDANQNNFSTLSVGLLGVGASIEQTVYFEGASNATDQFAIRLRLSQTLLDLNVANNIRIIASNGGTVVQNVSLNSLLTLNLLSLSGGTVTTIPIAPGAPVDRITVQFLSLVSASVSQNLDLFGVVRTPARPVITDPGTTNPLICSGQTASLLADTQAGNELRFYDAPAGGTLLQTVAAGSTFTTPALATNTTYYVAAAKIGCPEESARVAITVTIAVIATPTTLNTTQDLCAFNAPTLADLQVNEPGIVFYSDATDGTPLPLTTALTNGTIYYAALIDPVTTCESAVRLAITVNLNNLCAVTFNLKVLLQGPLFGGQGNLMRDDLRQQGLIPLAQPYSSALNARFTHVNGGGNEVTTQAVLDANAGTGDAIVDWVFIEVRDAANPATVLRTASALVQRDGDIIAANGGVLALDGLPSSFTVAIKHRNHFGALSGQTLNVVDGAVTLDFTTLSDNDIFTLQGANGQIAMATIGGVRALYAGNANFDRQIKYDGAANDRQVTAGQVLSFPGNTSQLLNFANATVYASGDVNLDGRVLYDGANNDRQLILNVVLTYPLNQNTLGNFNGIFEQIPQ